MPVISKITTQQKRKDRYNIFLKEQDREYYSFSVNEDILITYHLHKGMELTTEVINQIKEQDTAQKAYLLAIKYLSYRIRSEKEVIDYLVGKDIDHEYIEEVVTRLRQEGYLDDLAFSEALVNTRIQTSSKGPVMIKKELLDKGVSLQWIEQTLAAYTFEKQLAKVEKWVQKQLKPNAKKSHQQQINSLKQSLLQKGFTPDVIAVAIEQLAADRDQEAEYNAVIFQGEKLMTKYQKKDTGFTLEQKVKAALYRKGFPTDLIDRFMAEYVEE